MTQTSFITDIAVFVAVVAGSCLLLALVALVRGRRRTDTRRSKDGGSFSFDDFWSGASCGGGCGGGCRG